MFVDQSAFTYKRQIQGENTLAYYSCSTTVSITTVSIKASFATFSIATLRITTLCHYVECHFLFIIMHAECCYAECRSAITAAVLVTKKVYKIGQCS
jgi:hypothetical protein